jgi:sugar phosphate isomerase/epimerase
MPDSAALGGRGQWEHENHQGRIRLHANFGTEAIRPTLEPAMNLSFATLGCPDWTLEQIAANAKAFGYQGVELRTHDDGNHISPNISVEEAKAIGKMFRAKGVPVLSIMGYCRFAYPDPAEVAKNQELMRKLIVIADAMGAQFIRTFAGWFPKDANRDEMTQIVGNALKPLAAEAAKRKVRIALETHDEWCGGKLVMKVAKIVDNKKGFGIVYDVFNSYHSGIEEWQDTYKKVRNHIAYCHIKDAYQGLDGKQHYVLMGAGDMPYKKIFKRFRKDGYKGFFSFEWEKKWHPEIAGPEEAFPHYPHKMRALWKADKKAKKAKKAAAGK